jgi:hypothetical protein
MSYPSLSPNLSHSNPPDPNPPTVYSAIAYVAGAAGRVARRRSGEHEATGFCRSHAGARRTRGLMQAYVLCVLLSMVPADVGVELGGSCNGRAGQVVKAG